LLLVCAGDAHSSNYQTLRSFGVADTSGHGPSAAPIEGRDSFLYGVTFRGGQANRGVVYRVTPDGRDYRVIRHLGIAADDPEYPVGALIEDGEGTLYGVSLWGGASGGGTVFKLNRDGTGLVVLRHFGSGDQEPHCPTGGLTRSGEFLFGTCLLGGTNGSGVLFRMQPSASEYVVLRHFGGYDLDGQYPTGGVTKGPGEMFFGVTAGGGSTGGGTLFKIQEDGAAYTTVRQFNGGTADGLHPLRELIVANDGALYGVAKKGGSANKGILFKIDAQDFKFRIVYSFGASSNSAQFPSSGLLDGADGFLYGSAEIGGTGKEGCVFRIGKDGLNFSVIHSFDAVTGDGGAPETALARMGDGTLAGVVNVGGRFRQGNLFRMQKDGEGYTQIHEFSSSANDGTRPVNALTSTQEGFFYGNCREGGAYNNGILFRVLADGNGYETLHQFGPEATNGLCPVGSLLQASDGSLYGATRRGGRSGAGTVFRFMKETGLFSVVHHFETNSFLGAFPLDGVIESSDGGLYGRTFAGGVSNASTIYRLRPDGSEFSILHHFENGMPDDGLPHSGLLEARDGDLYGTTCYGGAHQAGSVFKLSKDGRSFTALHDFSWAGQDARYAHGGVVEVKSGKLYGTSMGGGTHEAGTVFSLNLDGSEYAVIHSFALSGEVGYSPVASLVEASDGYVYGTTLQGAGYGWGGVFRLDLRDQSVRALYAFRGEPNDAAFSCASLVAQPNGELFGTAARGGAFGEGAIFRILPLNLAAGRDGPNVTVSWRGFVGQNHRLQAAEVLPSWYDLMICSNVSGTIVYHETNSLRKQRLFRIQNPSNVLTNIIADRPASSLEWTSARKQNEQITASGDTFSFEGREFKLALDQNTGLPQQISTFRARPSASREWLHQAVQLTVRNQNSGAMGVPGPQAKRGVPGFGLAYLRGTLSGLSLVLTQQWSVVRDGILWQCTLSGTNARAGHDIILDFPILAPGLKIFTPTDYGTMDLDSHPSYQAPWYGGQGFDPGNTFTLPLVSVMDPAADCGLTIALPADHILPGFQVVWEDRRLLRFTFYNRAMGGDRPSVLKVLFLSHAADYRDALDKYVRLFPEYFNPGLPRGNSEGTFYYHHIQNHPELEEMARQQVRFLWSSFWFTHMGEFLPPANIWKPYTFTNLWQFGELMSDQRIRSFTQDLKAAGVGTYAYFNVNEWGGKDGETGSWLGSDQVLQQRFPDAVVKDFGNNAIITWEGSKVVNPGPQYSLWAFYLEQIQEHLIRLPEIEGFVIDRLDWAGHADWAHDDGENMSQLRPFEHLSGPVAKVIYQLSQAAHAKAKRVFVNVPFRLEPLRGVDGICSEQHSRSLAYLGPYRPISSWNPHNRYSGDLTRLEAQLKQRLQFAIFPHMISHAFPMSQEEPDAEAADLMEVFAPLFAKFVGKSQVLLPHCVSVTGPNDINLFTNALGQMVVPVTSRLKFLCRPQSDDDGAMVRLRTLENISLRWAHAYSADGPPYRVEVGYDGALATAFLDKHKSSTVLILGSDPEPPLGSETPRLSEIRKQLIASVGPASVPADLPLLTAVSNVFLHVEGVQLGTPGVLRVLVNGSELGRIEGTTNDVLFQMTGDALSGDPPAVSLLYGDEGTWFLPRTIQLLADVAGNRCQVAGWTEADVRYGGWDRVSFPLMWSVPRCLSTNMPRSVARDVGRGGNWIGRFGTKGYWIPFVATNRNGFDVKVTEGRPLIALRSAAGDNRVPESPSGAAPLVTSWYNGDVVELEIRPPSDDTIRLTLYYYDYASSGNSTRISVYSAFGMHDEQTAALSETDKGVYLTWEIAGQTRVRVAKLIGYDVAVAGLFFD
jgi:uncharacterized repeat protein (TIGR03803 family)